MKEQEEKKIGREETEKIRIGGGTGTGSGK